MTDVKTLASNFKCAHTTRQSALPLHDTQECKHSHHRRRDHSERSATPTHPICMASGTDPAYCMGLENGKTTTWAFFIGVRCKKPTPNFKQNLRKAQKVLERLLITFLRFRGRLRNLLYSKLGYLQKTLASGTSDSRIPRYFKFGAA